jgi:hypothetical protein
MKKLFYFVIFALFLAACSKEDVNIDINPKNIIGSWKLTYIYTDNTPNEINFANYNKYERYEIDPADAMCFTFLADTECGLIFWIGENIPESGGAVYSYEINNNFINNTDCCNCDNDLPVVHLNLMRYWSIVNNKLILARHNEAQTIYDVCIRL